MLPLNCSASPMCDAWLCHPQIVDLLYMKVSLNNFCHDFILNINKSELYVAPNIYDHPEDESKLL